jgi:hypothetical protein
MLDMPRPENQSTDEWIAGLSGRYDGRLFNADEKGLQDDDQKSDFAFVLGWRLSCIARRIQDCCTGDE